MCWRMIFVSVLCATLSFLIVNSAPTSLKSADEAKVAAKLTADNEAAHEKPLVRTKRAEEILYGNHQNAPRVKKSELPAAPDDSDVRAKTDDASNIEAKSESPMGENEPEDPSLPADKEEEVDDPTDDQQNLEEVPAEVDESEYARYEGSSEVEEPEESETLRKKRSTKTATLMTAENMVANSDARSIANRPVRAKRDLDYEELRQLFENSREVPYELEGQDDEIEGPEAVYEIVPDEGSDEEDGEEEEIEVDERSGGPLSVAFPYSYDQRYEPPSEKEELISELVEKKVEEDAKERLIDYLLAAAIASESESVDGGEEGHSDNDDGSIIVGPNRQNYEELDEDDPVAIGPVAVKRNMFYPYSYEPYGGRWGAMVPGSKRSVNEYERLYRLAEALNADEDYEEK